MVDLDNIRKMIPSNLLPSTYEGRIESIDESLTKEGGQSIRINVAIITPKKFQGELTMIMIRIPKALTGAGQGDMLLKFIRKMGYTNTDMLIGNDYVFERHSLKELAKETGRRIPASFTEHPRHYPVRPIPVTEPTEPS